MVPGVDRPRRRVARPRSFSVDHVIALDHGGDPLDPGNPAGAPGLHLLEGHEAAARAPDPPEHRPRLVTDLVAAGLHSCPRPCHQADARPTRDTTSDELGDRHARAPQARRAGWHTPPLGRRRPGGEGTRTCSSAACRGSSARPGPGTVLLRDQLELKDLHVVSDERTVELLYDLGSKRWRLVSVAAQSEVFWMTRSAKTAIQPPGSGRTGLR